MLRVPVRLTLFLGWIVLCIPVQVIARALNLPLRRSFPVFFHKVALRHIFGIRVIQQGNISTHCPTLFVANHISYLDIPAIASLMPISFIAKAEVARWPLFGLLARLQDTLFVERRARLTHAQSQDIASTLQQNRNLVIFPEGTSTDGTTVLPFKPSLLQSVFTGDDASIMLQPVAVACEGGNGKAALYPWYGDMTLVDHLLKILAVDGLTVTVTFLPPVPASRFQGRKELADYLHQQVKSAPHGVKLIGN